MSFITGVPSRFNPVPVPSETTVSSTSGSDLVLLVISHGPGPGLLRPRVLLPLGQSHPCGWDSVLKCRSVLGSSRDYALKCRTGRGVLWGLHVTVLGRSWGPLPQWYTISLRTLRTLPCRVLVSETHSDLLGPPDYLGVCGFTVSRDHSPTVHQLFSHHDRRLPVPTVISKDLLELSLSLLLFQSYRISCLPRRIGSLRSTYVNRVVYR